MCQMFFLIFIQLQAKTIFITQKTSLKDEKANAS